MTVTKLTEKYRPKTFKNMVGQAHLIGPEGFLKTIFQNQERTSLIFYGPPGTGKTTMANILAENINLPIYKRNATSASITEIKKLKPPYVLYLDEIQAFNKKQQQSLLPLIEENGVVLIAATTENPYHAIYDALLSRVTICEFKPISPEDIKSYLKSIPELNTIEDEVLEKVGAINGGDLRRSLNMAELLINQHPDKTITKEHLKNILPGTIMSGFDMAEDVHYSLLSALHKSIRGSDPDAAVFYLTRFLEGGDILSPIRRLSVIVSEDIGMADPRSAGLALELLNVATKLGLPEAYYPLTHAAILLATAPKSNSVGLAFNKAKEDIKAGHGITIPSHIAYHAPHNYLFPHNFKNHWVKQDYLPEDLSGKKYYIEGPNKVEQSLKTYWDTVKK